MISLKKSLTKKWFLGGNLFLGHYFSLTKLLVISLMGSRNHFLGPYLSFTKLLVISLMGSRNHFLGPYFSFTKVVVISLSGGKKCHTDEKLLQLVDHEYEHSKMSFPRNFFKKKCLKLNQKNSIFLLVGDTKMPSRLPGWHFSNSDTPNLPFIEQATFCTWTNISFFNISDKRFFKRAILDFHKIK